MVLEDTRLRHIDSDDRDSEKGDEDYAEASSLRLRPRRSLSACDQPDLGRTCVHNEFPRSCPYCSRHSTPDPGPFSPGPSIRDSRFYENSSVNLEHGLKGNDSRKVDLIGLRDKNSLTKQSSDGNMNPLASVNCKINLVCDRSKGKKSNPLNAMSEVIQSLEKISSVETENQSSGSDDTLVDQDTLPEYSSRDSNLDQSPSSDSTARPAGPSKKSCQIQSMNADRSIGKSDSPTYIRNSKIDGCHKSSDTYRKSLAPKSSSLLRQSFNSQNMIESNRTDVEFTKSPESTRRNSTVADSGLRSSHSSLDMKSHPAARPSHSSSFENKNLYQTFANQYVSSPNSRRHVRINPANLLEYDKRDSSRRPNSRQDDPNIYKESPVCFRKTKEASHSHAEQINELNRRMTKSQYYSPGSARNVSFDRNSLVQLSDGKVYKSRPASLHPEFSSVPAAQLEPALPIYSAGMSPTLAPRAPYVRRHSSLRAQSPASPVVDARRSAFVKYPPTLGYFLPAMHYYHQDVLGYYSPLPSTQWEAELNCHSLSDTPPSSPPPPLPVPNLTHEEMFEEPVEEPHMGGERIVWTFHDVTLNRVPGYGFGIAVSGGRDNPHFTNGDPAIAISDVLKAGPAEGKLLVNDRIMSANGLSLENVEYGTAVQVLRDSGGTVTLKVRRRIVLPASPEPQTLRLQLSKSRKKDDFGIVLGNKIFVKEVAARADNNAAPGAPQLSEGDVLLKINNHPTEGMSVKEARKLIDSSKEKLSLTIRREVPRPTAYQESTTLPGKENNYMDPLSPTGNYSSQNLYVQPPTRVGVGPNNLQEDKSNLLPRAGRSRNPLLDVSLSQLDRPVTPANNSMDSLGSPAGPNHKRSHTMSHDSLLGSSPSHHNHSRSRSDPPEPPRPPPPRTDDYYSSTRQLYEEDPLSRSKVPVPDPRFITFQKEGSVGIRLTGGNKVGIFVTAVQPGSPASLQGLQPGDKILKVNDMDMKGITREEAVLFLLSLQDQIHLIVQNRREEYEQVVASQHGDSFHIKTHFNYDQPDKGEMSFRKGDVFHVIDTLHNGVVGSWQVFRIGRNHQEVQKGIIPNKARAEELATAQFNASKKELSSSESRGSFFRRRRPAHRRSKSLGKDHWDDVVFGDAISKFPAYERVGLRHPGFVRPVVLFGPVADLARERLLKDFPDKFSAPQLENMMEEADSKKCSGIIRLSAIRDMMDRGRHGLLDITPNAVDRLNYAQFYPIVIFLRAETKQNVKELRAGIPKTAHKSSKKLLEQCQKLEKVWSHVFTGTITLGGVDAWYRKTRELIEKQQSSPVWISETKPDESLGDDFLFPMTASLRLSYASSPESDLEQSGGLLPSPRLVKCSSDPSIATQEEGVPAYTAPPPYTPSVFKQANYDPSSKPLRSVSNVADSPSAPAAGKYAPAGGGGGFSPPHSPLAPPASAGGPPPDLPPRIDRTNKPPRANPPRPSATERLFGERREREGGAGAGGKEAGEAPNYINATPHRTGHTSLERHNTTRTTSSYDSVSSYESFQRVGGPPAPSLGPNAHDDLKSINGDPTRGGRGSHDPYRFTRSTKQPISGASTTPLPAQHEKLMKPADYPKYRPPGGSGIVEYATSKPLPPPKTPAAPPAHQYKPVPPPKPKNYRPPHSYYQQATIKDTALYQSSKDPSMGVYQGGKESIYQGKDSIYQGKDSMYQGKDSMYQGKDSMYQGKDSMYQGKDSMYQGKDSMYQGKDSMYQGKDSIYQGKDSMYQGAKDSSVYQSSKDTSLYQGKDSGLYQSSKPNHYSVNDTGMYGVHHGLSNGNGTVNGVPSSPSKYSVESELNGGFDSGHGSSLDRTYDRRGPPHHSQYYYNVTNQRGNHGNSHSNHGNNHSNHGNSHSNHGNGHSNHGNNHGLDLTHRADQRGSAFELYKKPSDPRNINNYQLEHAAIR